MLDPARPEFASDHPQLLQFLQGNIRQAQPRTTRLYNRRRKAIEFRVGVMVLVNRRNWKRSRPSPKLDTRFATIQSPLERIPRRRSYLGNARLSGLPGTHPEV